jgi:hypothetical protein
MKYRRKAGQIVDAEQYAEYGKLVKGMCNSVSCYVAVNDKPHVHTIHDNQIVNLEVGDWILPEPDGEHFYPVKPDIFDKTYEPANEPTPDKVKQEPDGEWREKYYDLQERYEEKKEAASMWAKKCMEKHQDYLALLELQEKTEKKVKAENYQTILGLKQQLQSLTAEVKRLKEQQGEAVELLEKMAAAIEQTFKQYASPNALREQDEYEISFLYPANNRAFQMLREAMRRYQLFTQSKSTQ